MYLPGSAWTERMPQRSQEEVVGGWETRTTGAPTARRGGGRGGVIVARTLAAAVQGGWEASPCLCACVQDLLFLPPEWSILLAS
mmetsp:Transcript_12342/g.39121  ORF Transcript_12342/g.39121 Transcript_12342/m.39121 type:complete len:84 (+) Transcript_12342:254-505(+)